MISLARIYRRKHRVLVVVSARVYKHIPIVSIFPIRTILRRNNNNNLALNPDRHLFSLYRGITAHFRHHHHHHPYAIPTYPERKKEIARI